MSRKRLWAVASLLGLLAAGCGGSSSSSTPAGSSGGSAVGPSLVPTTVPAPGPIAASDLSPAGTISAKPTIVVPSSPPPANLQSADLIPGTGATTKIGDTITVNYVGVSYSTKQQFDASWDHGSPTQFPLNPGGLIEGWILGIPGMKVGGRRELIIPPSLGYGNSPPPGSGIKPGETLIFIVDLVKIG